MRVLDLLCLMAENPEFRSLPSFLFGASMGGAVALKMHCKQPNAWTGAVLVAPMCKVISESRSMYQDFLYEFRTFD